MMKLAEALIRRGDAQKRISWLRDRLERNAVIRYGELPVEDPTDLLDDLHQTVKQLTSLVKIINRTNLATRFDDNRTLTDVLAERDALLLERNVLNAVIRAASNEQPHHNRSRVRFKTTVDVFELQRRADELAQQYRELDIRIQALNWQTELVKHRSRKPWLRIRLPWQRAKAKHYKSGPSPY